MPIASAAATRRQLVGFADEAVNLVHEGAETRQFRPLQALTRVDPRGHRIHPLIVDEHLEVEMVAGRQSGMSDLGDHLALADMRALGDPWREGIEMRIGRGVARAVADANVESVVAAPTQILDDAVGRRQHRRAARRAIVDAAMHAAGAQYRIDPHAVAGADLAAGDRGYERRGRGHSAFAIEGARLPVPGRIAVDLMLLALDPERRVAELDAIGLPPGGSGGPIVDHLALGARRPPHGKAQVMAEDLTHSAGDPRPTACRYQSGTKAR